MVYASFSEFLFSLPLGILYGPLWGLVALFVVMGVIFLLKAVECMGLGFWQIVADARTRFKSRLRRKNPHQVRAELSNDPLWNQEISLGAAGISDAGNVLFPGEASLAEALEIAYSEEGDEALFTLCCKQELEDILSKAADKPGVSQPMPVDFLPLVVEECNKLSINAAIEEEVQQDSLLEFLPLEPGDRDEQEGEFKEKVIEAGDRPVFAGTTSKRHVAEGDSIFKALIDKCDVDTQLVLVQALEEVADNKELHLLEVLRFNAHPRVRKLADKLYNRLRTSLEPEANESDQRPESEVWIGAEASVKPKEKQSLEFCFLGREELSGIRQPMGTGLEMEQNGQV